MTFSVAIRTVPQRKELFDSLMARLARESVPIHVSDSTAISPNENACVALEKAMATPAQWVLFLEDDAGLIDDFFGSAARWLDDHEQSDVHAYPMGCQYPLSPDPRVTSWKYPIDAFYCSVAVVFRASLVPSVVGYFRRNSHINQCFDLLVGRWHRLMSDSPHLLTPVPCFVEHLGDRSTLIDGRPDRDEVGRFQGFRGFGHSYVSRGAST